VKSGGHPMVPFSAAEMQQWETRQQRGVGALAVVASL